MLSTDLLLCNNASESGQNTSMRASFSVMRVMWYFAWYDLMGPELILHISKQSKLLLPPQPQWLPHKVPSSSPSSVNVIRVIHLTPSLVWLNYLASLWTAKLIPCDFNKLRGEGESLSEGGQWLLFSNASLMNVSGRSVQPGAGSAIPQLVSVNSSASAKKGQGEGGQSWETVVRLYPSDEAATCSHPSVSPPLAAIRAPGWSRWT